MADPLAAFPNQISNGDTPDADLAMANWNHVRTYLNARLGNLSDGEILIANSSGQVVGKTMSGDATMTREGVVSLAADSVDSAEIAANAVGTSEIAAGAVDTNELADAAASGAKYALTYDSGSYDANPGISSGVADLISLSPANATYLVTATFWTDTSFGGTKSGFGRLYANGGSTVHALPFVNSGAGGAVSITDIITVTGGNPVKAQYSTTVGSFAMEARLVVVRLAA